MRFLIIFLAVLFVVLSVRALLAKPENKRSSRPRSGGNESMVPCTLCRLHIPKSEALVSDNHFFCSPAHQAEWLTKQKEHTDNGGA